METGGKIFPAPGELDALSSFFPPRDEAGVDLAEEGLKGSFLEASPLLPLVPFSLGDLLPLLVPLPFVVTLASLSSSTTKSASLRSPSLSSFLSFLASGDLLRSPGEFDEILLCKIERKVYQQQCIKLYHHHSNITLSM